MSSPRVVAVSRDLMDRSKLSAALPDATLVRSPAELTDAGPGGGDVVIVDLSIAGALDAALATGATVVAYGSHVDDRTLADARELGADAMPRSLFFRRLGERTLFD